MDVDMVVAVFLSDPIPYAYPWGTELSEHFIFLAVCLTIPDTIENANRSLFSRIADDCDDRDD
jgi:hypothetical protein